VTSLPRRLPSACRARNTVPRTVPGERDEYLTDKANHLLAELTAAKEALVEDTRRFEEAIGRARTLLVDEPNFPYPATDVVAAYQTATEDLTRFYLDAVDQAYSIDLATARKGE